MSIKKHSIWNKRYIGLVSILNIILTSLVLAHNQAINRDGILYLRTVEAFLTQGIHGAISVYSWPGYSIIVGYITKLTTFSPLVSAYVLNTTMLIGATLAFSALSHEIYKDIKHALAAGAIFLCWASLNQMRDDVIRDFGYVCFFLWGIFFFSRYVQREKIADALLWQATFLLAALFRIEGVIYLSVPLLFLVMPSAGINFKQRLRHLLMTSSIAIALLGVAILLAPAFLQLARIQESLMLIENSFINISSMFTRYLTQAKMHVLNEYSRGEAVAFLSWGMFGIGLANILKMLGFPYFVLVCISVAKGYALKLYHLNKTVLAGFMLLTLAMISGFLAQRLFLSERYVMSLSALLLLSLPPLVVDGFETSKKTRIILIVIFIYQLLASVLHFGSSSSYIKQSGEWIAKQTASTARIVSNDVRIPFYAARAGDIQESAGLMKFLLKNKTRIWRQYDVVAVRLSHSRQNMRAQIEAVLKTSLRERFINNRNDEILIYVKPGTTQ